MNPSDILKYLTPELITMITVFGILLIIIIISIFLLIYFRKGTFVQKIIWNIKEMRNLLSNVPSYYSQKRIKSSVAFWSAELLIIFYDIIHRNSISASEIGAHAVILFGIAGYHLSQTQQEKLNISNTITPDVPIPVIPVVDPTISVNPVVTPDPTPDVPVDPPSD